MNKIYQFTRPILKITMVLFFMLAALLAPMGPVSAEGPVESTEVADGPTMPHVLEPVGISINEFIQEEGCESLYALPHSQLENSLTDKDIKTMTEECPDFVESMEVSPETNVLMSRGPLNTIYFNPPSGHWYIILQRWGWRGSLRNWGWHFYHDRYIPNDREFYRLPRGYYRVIAQTQINGQWSSWWRCGSDINWTAPWSNGKTAERSC